MSSTERAPEPTMEEILASIRRIITDDETGQAKAQTAERKSQSDDSEGEGEADSQIIDDIARVLSSSSSKPQATEEEEILDLTAELGGLELVEDDETQPEMEADEGPVFMPSAPPEPTAQDAAPQMPQPEPPVSPQPEAVMPEPEAAPPVAPPMPEPAQPAAPPMSASEAAASALERAIAALKAGQSPASTTPPAEPFEFQAAPQPEPAPDAMLTPDAPMPEPMADLAPQPEPIPMAVPMGAPEPVAETHPEPAPMMGDSSYDAGFDAQPEFAPTIEPMVEPTAEAAPQPDAELVLTEAEMTVIEAPEELEPDDVAPEAEEEPFWPGGTPAFSAEPSEPEPEPAFEPDVAPEPVAAQLNGGAHDYDSAAKTLEDSIKDMLRPMLREWLDENMPRIVRDQLDAERHQD